MKSWRWKYAGSERALAVDAKQWKQFVMTRNYWFKRIVDCRLNHLPGQCELCQQQSNRGA